MERGSDSWGEGREPNQRLYTLGGVHAARRPCLLQRAPDAPLPPQCCCHWQAHEVAQDIFVAVETFFSVALLMTVSRMRRCRITSSVALSTRGGAHSVEVSEETGGTHQWLYPMACMR